MEAYRAYVCRYACLHEQPYACMIFSVSLFLHVLLQMLGGFKREQDCGWRGNRRTMPKRVSAFELYLQLYVHNWEHIYALVVYSVIVHD